MFVCRRSTCSSYYHIDDYKMKLTLFNRHRGSQLCVLMSIIKLLGFTVNYAGSSSPIVLRDIYIFHVIDNALWGETDGTALQGIFPCSVNSSNSTIRNDIMLGRCELVSSVLPSQFLENKTTDLNFADFIQSKLEHYNKNMFRTGRLATTVSMYNIHTWGTLSKWPHPPDKVKLNTTFTLAESEESSSRFSKLFRTSFPHFDASSTTSPFSTIQRTYFSGLNASEFLPMKPFHSLIKGASFVASTCHRGSGGTTKRLAVVLELQKYMRVDSLGKCLHSKATGPEKPVSLGVGRTAKESLEMKREAISQYMFYLAFENTYERGYVTEKVFDALIAGVVPVYLGSSVDCRPLLPRSSPCAAIFVDDFDGDMRKLAAYLTYLASNQTAYDALRGWRNEFVLGTSGSGSNSSSGNKNGATETGCGSKTLSPLFAKSWPCRICEWAFKKANGMES